MSYINGVHCIHSLAPLDFEANGISICHWSYCLYKLCYYDGSKEIFQVSFLEIKLLVNEF